MYYIFEDGDTLPKLADKFYSDRNKWEQIYHANPDVIILLPGTTVLIPMN